MPYKKLVPLFSRPEAGLATAVGAHNKLAEGEKATTIRDRLDDFEMGLCENWVIQYQLVSQKYATVVFPLFSSCITHSKKTAHRPQGGVWEGRRRGEGRNARLMLA